MQDKLITQGINSKGFGTIPKILMQDKRVHVTAKAIYAYFCSYAGGGETAFPSRTKICEDLGIAIDTLGKYLKQLVTYGYLKIEQQKDNGKFSHNVYTLLSEITVSGNSVHGNSVHGNSDTNIINTNINIINTNISNKEKTKEINKEISSESETTRDTKVSASLTEGEKLTPNPLIKDKQEFIREINKYTQDTKLRELLTDYLISRLEQNPNMSLINFKASLATLTEATCYCEIPDFSMEYQYKVVINATTASYSQFKPIFDKKYKSNQAIQENFNKAPFGDHSRCIPAGNDLELALDDNGNPIKF